MNPHMFLMLPMKAARAAASHFPVAAASFMHVIKKEKKGKSWARLYTQFARWLLLPKLNEPPVSVMVSELQPRCFSLPTSEKKKQREKNCRARGGRFDLCTPSSDLQMQRLFRMNFFLCNHALSFNKYSFIFCPQVFQSSGSRGHRSLAHKKSHFSAL